MGIINIFDPYERKARLYPALLVVLPLTISLLLWFPELLDLSRLLWVLIVSSGLLFLLSKISREMGKKKEKKLIQEWGALPSTLLLRHNDSTIDPITKNRYHSYLMKHITGLELPPKETENNATNEYNTAVRWLLEQTRGDKLLLKDNINYGFSRNLLGLKPIGLILSIVSLSFCIVGIYWRYKYDFSSVVPEVWISTIISAGFLIFWLKMVNSSWVKSTGTAYARTLLAHCDSKIK
jgi:hypothetical protein